MRKPGFLAQAIYFVSFGVAALWLWVVWFHTSWPRNLAPINPATNQLHGVTFLTAALVLIHFGLFMDNLRRPTALAHWLFPWKTPKDFLKSVRDYAIAAAIIYGLYNFVEPARTWWDSWHLPQGYIGAVLMTLTIPYAIARLPIGLFTLDEWVREHPLFRRWFRFGRGGQDRWAGPRALEKLNFDFFMEQNRKEAFYGCRRAAPAYLGKALVEDSHQPAGRTEHLGIDNDSMMLVCGMTGSGKTRDFYGNLHMTWPGGAFILDPKKEHYQLTSKRRKWFGPVYRLDPWLDEEGTGNHWNPLDEIDIKADSAADDILNHIAEALVLEEPGEKNARHFVDMAKIIVAGIIAHVLSTYPKERQTLPACYDAFVSGGDPDKPADPQFFMRLIAEMEQNNAASGLPKQAATFLREAGESGEKGGAITTTLRSLRWCSSKSLRRVLAKSDFTFRSMKDNRATVYSVIPFENMENQARWMRLQLNVALITTRKTPRVRYLPEKDGSVVRVLPESQAPNLFFHRVLFSLDEFLALGYCRTIITALNQLRSADIKLVMAVQNLADLRALYGDRWGNFISASDRMAFGINDEFTAETFSKSLGQYVERQHEGQDQMEHLRPLLSPTEITQYLSKDSGKAIVIPTTDTGGLPLRVAKTPYWDNFRKDQLGAITPVRFTPSSSDDAPAVSDDGFLAGVRAAMNAAPNNPPPPKPAPDDDSSLTVRPPPKPNTAPPQPEPQAAAEPEVFSTDWHRKNYENKLRDAGIDPSTAPTYDEAVAKYASASDESKPDPATAPSDAEAAKTDFQADWDRIEQDPERQRLIAEYRDQQHAEMMAELENSDDPDIRAFLAARNPSPQPTTAREKVINFDAARDARLFAAWQNASDEEKAEIAKRAQSKAAVETIDQLFADMANRQAEAWRRELGLPPKPDSDGYPQPQPDSTNHGMSEAEARAILRYGAKQPITKAELRRRYGVVWESAPPDFRPKVDQAFEVLKAIATD